MPAPQRVVLFRPRTVLQVVGVLLGVAVALWIVWVSIRVRSRWSPACASCSCAA
jgi:hypothetical protein